MAALLKAYGLPALLLIALLSAGVWYRHHVATQAYANGERAGAESGRQLAAQARQAQGRAEQQIGQCRAALAAIDAQTRKSQQAADERARQAQAAQAKAQQVAQLALADLADWKEKYRAAVASAACSHARDQLCAALQDY